MIEAMSESAYSFPALQSEVSQHYQRVLHVLSTSGRPCYVDNGAVHTYPEMGRAIHGLNGAFKGLRGKRVALYAGKSFETYAAIHAILLSGNTWVPFNPDLPDDRNRRMFELAAPDLVLTDRPLPDSLVHVAEMTRTSVLDLSQACAGTPAAKFDTDSIRPDEIAVIYFTSGSTGEPKGVPVTQASLARNVNNILNALDLRTGEVFADYHDLAFIISIPIVFPCLLCEGAIAPATSKADSFLPTKHLIRNKVTVLISVPSTMSRVRRASPEGVEGLDLKVVVMCGEPFHLDLLRYCFDHIRMEKLFNFYGSTEVGPWTFHHPCLAEDDTRYAAHGMAPIGTPLPGNLVCIEDGELWCSGPQIMPGYLGGIGRDSIVEKDGALWFRTGDHVRVEDGVFICKGRLDAQVKIGGYRVDLGEPEAHLRRIEGVNAAICFVVGEADDRRIVAVLNSNRALSVAEVRTALKDRLPVYMMPRQVLNIADMPLNKSGKIDRLAVRKWYAEQVEHKQESNA